MPKKKGGKKGAKIIDGLATNEMSREQLMGHVKRMQVQLVPLSKRAKDLFSPNLRI